MRDGETRYTTSIDVEGDEISAALVRDVLRANVAIMDLYWPGFMTVLCTDTPARDAVASIMEV